MISITVHLASALICISGACQPALVGADTPPGQYRLERAITPVAGYGGSVLAFHQDASGTYAIHRPWLGRPAERREERLYGTGSRVITAGCINVTPELYNWLETYCASCALEVLP